MPSRHGLTHVTSHTPQQSARSDLLLPQTNQRGVMPAHLHIARRRARLLILHAIQQRTNAHPHRSGLRSLGNDIDTRIQVLVESVLGRHAEITRMAAAVRPFAEVVQDVCVTLADSREKALDDDFACGLESGYPWLVKVVTAK